MVAKAMPERRELNALERLRAAYPPFLANGEGKCADPQVNPDWFHPDDERARNKALYTRLAKATCRHCPFKYRCEEWANETEQDGIYGGHTRQERQARRHGFTGAGRYRAVL